MNGIDPTQLHLTVYRDQQRKMEKMEYQRAYSRRPYSEPVPRSLADRYNSARAWVLGFAVSIVALFALIQLT